MKIIEVAAAIIIENGFVFTTQRGYGPFKGQWEFPGGKIEPGETPQQALLREIQEELSITVEIQEHIQTVEWDYPDFHLKMHCYCCSILSGEIRLSEHLAAQWIDRDQLETLDWLPADRQLLERVEEYMAYSEYEDDYDEQDGKYDAYA